MESFEFRVTLSILMERDKIGKKSGKNLETTRQYFYGERKGQARSDYLVD